MATIASLTENFTGAAAGVTISTANTAYNDVSNTAGSTNVFHGSAPLDVSPVASQRVAASNATTVSKFLLTGRAVVYFSYYLYLETPLPTANLIIFNWFSGTTLIGALRLTPTGGLQFRDGTSTQFTSTDLPTGEWHRIEVMINPGSATGHRLNIWSGSNINGVTTPSQSSGPVTATNAGLLDSATVDEFRLGIVGASNTAFRMARMRGDDAAFPAPVNPPAPPTVNLGPDQEVESGDTVSFPITTTGSGSLVLTQTSGPTVLLSGTEATRSFTMPALLTGGSPTATTVAFQATYGGANDTVTFTAPPHLLWRAMSASARSPVYRTRYTP